MDNWGDGLITDRTILAAHPLASSPAAFFEAVLQEPYLSQVCAWLDIPVAGSGKDCGRSAAACLTHDCHNGCSSMRCHICVP